jgi:hypothetical protein
LSSVAWRWVLEMRPMVRLPFENEKAARRRQVCASP